MVEFRRPESVLVVIHTPRRECLLLERTVPRGFWQSVTGTLRRRDTPAAAAVREVREETGLDCIEPGADTRADRALLRRLGPSTSETPALTATGVTRRFPIRPEWRGRYAPGVTENLEHLFYLELPEACCVTLNADEHIAWRWMDLENAIGKVASWTNREALERLRSCAVERQ